jgi:hypothetical protein
MAGVRHFPSFPSENGKICSYPIFAMPKEHRYAVAGWRWSTGGEMGMNSNIVARMY